jgi:hypothetical protein
MSIERSTSKINIFSKSLKIKRSYKYVWGNDIVGFLKTSNPLVDMTLSIDKHNKLIVFKNSCVLPLTPN